MAATYRIQLSTELGEDEFKKQFLKACIQRLSDLKLVKSKS